MEALGRFELPTCGLGILKYEAVQRNLNGLGWCPVLQSDGKLPD